MAAKLSIGSIILGILIVLMALLLVAVILVPDKIWKEEAQITNQSRANMTAVYEAEQFYYKTHREYTDSIPKLLEFVRNDSTLQQRQTLVSLTRSFMKVVDNIMNISSIKQISNLSQAAFEITGDLLGNRRYFRKYTEQNFEGISLEINREMMRFDSSAAFPNFCRTKLFVDSLRNLRDKISDYPLQNGILHAIHYADSLKTYYGSIEKDAVTEFWNGEYKKINDFIGAINKTDIKSVSSVGDRLKKFIDRISTSLDAINAANSEADLNKIVSESKNLSELHQKFLSPKFFILTKRYGLTGLNETDSILVNLREEQFYCPDSKLPYIIDTSYQGKLTVESPNLLDDFHQKFLESIEPVRDLPLIEQIDQLDTVLEKTKTVLNENKTLIRKNTDLLLSLKELLVEMDAISNVFFYKYTHELKNFIQILDKEKKLSVLKPEIENILNPMDTLATRIETGDVRDLETKLHYFDTKLKSLDSASMAMRLPRRQKNKLQSNAEVFQPVFDILSQIKAGFNPSYAEALRQAEKSLEHNLLQALEGKKETVYVIFKKKHINHGFIRQGVKSWEEK
ncbi:hypothetical protein B1H10_01005 [candidate division KSB1 bacterium 4484_188]|nr:MAG: hypothetical protein B1H10_01005 [candidate division KSB1 bacterium 4484_188]